MVEIDLIVLSVLFRVLLLLFYYFAPLRSHKSDCSLRGGV